MGTSSNKQLVCDQLLFDSKTSIQSIVLSVLNFQSLKSYIDEKSKPKRSLLCCSQLLNLYVNARTKSFFLLMMLKFNYLSFNFDSEVNPRGLIKLINTGDWCQLIANLRFHFNAIMCRCTNQLLTKSQCGSQTMAFVRMDWRTGGKKPTKYMSVVQFQRRQNKRMTGKCDCPQSKWHLLPFFYCSRANAIIKT